MRDVDHLQRVVNRVRRTAKALGTKTLIVTYHWARGQDARYGGGVGGSERVRSAIVSSEIRTPSTSIGEPDAHDIALAARHQFNAVAVRLEEVGEDRRPFLELRRPAQVIDCTLLGEVNGVAGTNAEQNATFGSKPRRGSD